MLSFWTLSPKIHQPTNPNILENQVHICLAWLICRLGSHINTHPILNTNAAVVRLFRTGEVQRLMLQVNRITHSQCV